MCSSTSRKNSLFLQCVCVLFCMHVICCLAHACVDTKINLGDSVKTHFL